MVRGGGGEEAKREREERGRTGQPCLVAPLSS